MHTLRHRRQSGTRSRAFRPIPDALEGRLLMTNDIAFYNPGSSWNTTPVLSANGNGSWIATNGASPSWANQPGVVAVPGYFGGGQEDIAFYRPGSNWNTIPVLFRNSNGGWTWTNDPVPSWANQPGVVAVTGDFTGSGRTDIAFYRPGSNSTTIPVLVPQRRRELDHDHNNTAPSWANQDWGVVAVTGYFGGNHDDIAFYRPGVVLGLDPGPVRQRRRELGPRTTTRRRPGPTSRASSPSREASGASSPSLAAVANSPALLSTVPGRPGARSRSCSPTATGAGPRTTTHAAPSWANQPGASSPSREASGAAPPLAASVANSPALLSTVPGSNWKPRSGSCSPTATGAGLRPTMRRRPGPTIPWASSPSRATSSADSTPALLSTIPGRSGTRPRSCPSTFNGGWSLTNDASPPWANQKGVIAVPFSYSNSPPSAGDQRLTGTSIRVSKPSGSTTVRTEAPPPRPAWAVRPPPWRAGSLALTTTS